VTQSVGDDRLAVTRLMIELKLSVSLHQHLSLEGFLLSHQSGSRGWVGQHLQLQWIMSRVYNTDSCSNTGGERGEGPR